MNKKKLTLLCLAALPVLVALQLRSLHKDLYGRFPDIDRQIIREAYRKMYLDVMRNKIDVEGKDDIEMDAIFLKYVRKVS